MTQALAQARKALASIAEGNLGDAPWQANYDRIRKVAADALAALEQSNPSPVDRFGMIDEASGHEPLYFGRVNDVQPWGISGEQYVRLSDYQALEASVALAAIDAAQGGVVPKVKVRALEWVDRGLGILYADSVVGTYKVNLDGYWWRDDGPLEGRGGQSAVRADYERRVLSALDLPLPPVGA